jgi:mercuric ion transport protein
LTLALAALALRAKTRRGLGPFLIGLIAAVGILLGKFAWESEVTIYASIGLLVVASVWNAWPRREQLHRMPITENFKDP